MKYQSWTDAENELMRLLVEARARPFEIANRFSSRGARSVYAKLLVTRRQLGPEVERRRKDFRHPNIIQDEAFQIAMTVAINAGLESAPIGIFVAPDNEDFRPKLYQPEPTHSGCSSAALECASVGVL